MASFDVLHETNQQRFIVSTSEGQAELDYVRTGSSVNFHHTFVPPTLRGRGIAELLVRAALTWAADEKLNVEASCSYVARFLDLHPELKQRTTPDE